MFDLSIITDNWAYLLTGLQYTIQVTLFAMVGGILLGTVIALMRLSDNKMMQSFAWVYVTVFRSIPLVLVLLVFFLFLPKMIGRPVGADQSAYVTFMLFEAAYYSEIIRSGIGSINQRQVAAAQSLGLNYTQSMRYIVLPQAFRNMLPVLLTQTIILFQDVSLVYVIGATDLLGAADKLNQRDLRPLELYTFVAVAYFIMCYSLSMLVRKLQAKVAILR